jgi:hypothetical protein
MNIITTITILYTVQRHVFYSNHDVSKTELSIRFSVPETGITSVDRTKLNRYHPRTETD